MTEFGLVGRTGSDRSRLESGNDAIRGTPRHGTRRESGNHVVCGAPGDRTRLTVGKRVTSTPARSRKPTCVGKRREQPRPTTNRPPRPGRSCLPGSKQPEVATRSGVVHRVARIRCFDAREATRSRHSMPGLAVRHHRVATFYSAAGSRHHWRSFVARRRHTYGRAAPLAVVRGPAAPHVRNTPGSINRKPIEEVRDTLEQMFDWSAKSL